MDRRDVESSGNRMREHAEPLIQSDQGSNKSSDDDHHQWIVYLSTFVAVCGSFQFGCCVGYSSPVQFQIMEELSLDVAQFSVFGSIVNFGAMFGAITSGPTADYIGRKGAMRIASIFCIVGWLAIALAKGAIALDIGRLASGYGMGVLSFVVPVFIAEFAPKNLRGSLGSLNQLMIVLGIAAAFVLGSVLPWRVLAWTGIISPVILLIGLTFVPESPRWLAKVGQRKACEVALQKLRGLNADISQEASEIQENIEQLKRLPKAGVKDLLQRRNFQPLFIGVGLMIFQQFGGINGTVFYTSYIFESAGFPASIGNISYSCLQVITTVLITFVIDKAGRKPLILTSGGGMFLGCILMGTSFYLKDHAMAPDAVSILLVTGILLYIGSFGIGMGAIPWVIMSEIFPIDIKGVGASIVTLINWISSWTVSYTFNFLISWSAYGTFFLYAAVNMLAILFIIVIVPETKGKTLEQIQASMN